MSHETICLVQVAAHRSTLRLEPFPLQNVVESLSTTGRLTNIKLTGNLKAAQETLAEAAWTKVFGSPQSKNTRKGMQMLSIIGHNCLSERICQPSLRIHKNLVLPTDVRMVINRSLSLQKVSCCVRGWFSSSLLSLPAHINDKVTPYGERIWNEVERGSPADFPQPRIGEVIAPSRADASSGEW